MSIEHTVKSVVQGLPHLVTGGVPSERAGTERLASRAHATSAGHLFVSSPAFAYGTPIPQKYSVDGAAISPPLRWSEVPGNAVSLVLLVEDPDAPTPEPFVHWIVSGLVPSAGEIPEAAQGLNEGLSSKLTKGWAGCAPPKGDNAHHYHFQLFALDEALELKPGIGRGELLERIAGHIVGFGELVGTYQR